MPVSWQLAGAKLMPSPGGYRQTKSTQPRKRPRWEVCELGWKFDDFLTCHHLPTERLQAVCRKPPAAGLAVKEAGATMLGMHPRKNAVACSRNREMSRSHSTVTEIDVVAANIPGGGAEGAKLCGTPKAWYWFLGGA